MMSCHRPISAKALRGNMDIFMYFIQDCLRSIPSVFSFILFFPTSPKCPSKGSQSASTSVKRPISVDYQCATKWVHHTIPTDSVPTDAIPTVHAQSGRRVADYSWIGLRAVLIGKTLNQIPKIRGSTIVWKYEGHSRSFATRPYRRMEMLQTTHYFSI